MKNSTRSFSLIALCAAMIGTAAIASAQDGKWDRRHDERQIDRTERHLDRLQNVQRRELKNDHPFKAGETHQKIENTRERLRDERHDLRKDWRKHD